MKCPVCKTECFNRYDCPECGFDQIDTVFLNKQDAENWYNTVAIPYRNNYWLRMKAKFVIEGSTLKSYLVSNNVITFPFGITSIGDCVFFNCEKDDRIEEVFIPSSVKVIESAAFSGETNLKRIHLKEGLETIENIAFEGCGLSSINLPDSVETLDEGFCSCKAKINVKKTNPYYKVENDCLIDMRSSTLLHCWSCKEIITIPTGVKRIGYRAFPFEMEERRKLVLSET